MIIGQSGQKQNNQAINPKVRENGRSERNGVRRCYSQPDYEKVPLLNHNVYSELRIDMSM